MNWWTYVLINIIFEFFYHSFPFFIKPWRFFLIKFEILFNQFCFYNVSSINNAIQGGKVRTEHHIKTFEIIQSCLTEFEIIIVISENIVFILE